MATENLIAKMRTEQFKRDIRFSFRSRAQLFQPQRSAFQVERLNENLVDFLAQQEGIWAGFKGQGHEPQIDKVIRLSPHLKWVYPSIEGHELKFIQSEKFETGRFGIEEPVGGEIVDVNEIQGFLVPGVAFDRMGVRLGRGKGFYDRALEKASGALVGVCFAFQIYDGLLPWESFDVRMDALISEQGTYLVSGI